MTSAVILGGAASVWDDHERAREIGRFDATIAVNDALAHYPGEVEIAATLHPEKLSDWLAARDAAGYSPPTIIAAHKGNTQVGRRNACPVDYVTDYRWPGMSASGSSGLFAVKVAIEHGFERIVLCGVPMQADGRHFFDARPWSEVNSFTEAWKAALPRINGATRSMSGWTRQLLGAPTPEWLAG